MATLRGTPKKDRLTGTSAKDTLSGLGDSDVLIGGAGNDTLKGGSGNDLLYGGNGNDMLYGGSGNDKLYGGSGGDTLDGGTGNDRLEGGSGNDTYIVRNVGDKIKDTGGFDLLRTTVSLTLGSGIEAAIVLGAGLVNLTGNALDNTLTGNAAANLLSGGAGNDILIGLGGNDTFGGGDGHDAMTGGAGNDIFYGGAGNDTMSSGGGTDQFIGGDGSDTADYSSDTSGLAILVDLTGINSPLGAAAGDTFSSIENITGTTVAGPGDTLTGNSSDNALIGLAGNDTLTGGGGLDTLLGGDGDDLFIGGDFGTGADIYNGGAGVDLVSYFGIASSIVVDLLLTNTAAGATGQGLNNDTFISIERLIGGTNSDFLSGSESDNAIGGGGGNDVIFGRGGADILNGNANDDTIDPGDDLAIDAVDGGTGNDTVSYAGHTSSGVFVQISGTSGSGGHVVVTDTYSNIENVIGTSLGDTIILDNTAGTELSADGGAGDDTLHSLAGVNSAAAIETLTGGAGFDTFVLHPNCFGNVLDFKSDLQSTPQAPDFDRIRLTSSELGGLATASGNLTNRTSDHNATLGHAQLIYDESTHSLWFDADGITGGEIAIASFGGNFAATLNSFGVSDFVFV